MKKKEFNVRIIVKGNGDLELGFVHCLRKRGPAYAWDSATEATRQSLASKLGCKARVPGRKGVVRGKTKL